MSEVICGINDFMKHEKESDMLLVRALRRSIVAFAIPCLLAIPASADIGYLEYFVGASFVPNQNLTGSIPSSATLMGSYQTDAGYVVGAAVGLDGYEVTDFKLRPEISLDYRRNEVSSLNAGAAGQFSTGEGDVSLFTAMLNGYVDYAPADANGKLDYPAIPYAGFGIGYGRLEISAENAMGATRINDKNSVFVWNVMAGAIVPFSETVSFRLGYRYLSTTEPELTARVSGIGPTRFDTEFDAHDVTVGLRIHF